jgi:uncharacterized phage protein (TIGR01671 family)
MKREILFKGKRIDNKEWVEGSLVMVCNGETLKRYPCIVISYNHDTFDWHEVDTKTVSQFINQKDKNNRKIFEGDFDNDGNCVAWCDNCNGFEFAQLDVPTKDICIPCHRCDGNFFFGDHIHDFEIVGNVAD